MQYATAFDIGKRKREQGGINEDSVAVDLLNDGHRDSERRAAVFTLADGAGGAKAGDVASYVITVEVTRRLTEKLWNTRRLGEIIDAGSRQGATMGTRGLGDSVTNDPLAEITDDGVHIIIEEAIQEAHTRLIEVINEYDLESAYSTVVAGIKIGDTFHYGWVGDSRAYVVNTAEERDEDQRVSLLTKDHSVVERLVNEGEIDEVEAYVHRRGNRVTRALGGNRGEDPEASRVDVDTNSIQLYGDDVLLITSDGLIDAYTGAPELHKQYEQADDTEQIEEAILEKSVTDDEIRDVILEAATLDAAAQEFVDLSNERGGKDNVSLVLFRDGNLPRSPVGGLPVRLYDPDPEEIYDWETVLMHSEDDADKPVASAESGGGGTASAAATAAEPEAASAAASPDAEGTTADVAAGADADPDESVAEEVDEDAESATESETEGTGSETEETDADTEESTAGDDGSGDDEGGDDSGPDASDFEFSFSSDSE